MPPDTRLPEPATRPRRERLRAQALAEIKAHALAQVAAGGAEALSLSGIARAMGVSGPALYRYFASRDALLAALVVEAYDGMADALEAAALASRRRAPAGRFRAVTVAYRAWALDEPHRYRLALGTAYGSGSFAREETLAASGRSMAVLVDAVAGLGPLPPRRAVRALDRQLEAWAASRGLPGELSPAAYELAVVTWTRLHGVIALELEGVFASMALDAGLLFDAEVERLLGEHAATARGD